MFVSNRLGFKDSIYEKSKRKEETTKRSLLFSFHVLIGNINMKANFITNLYHIVITSVIFLWTSKCNLFVYNML